MISPPSGTGYLGGDAPNIVEVNGFPHQCIVDLYYDGEYAGSQETLSDGSWRFSYLDTSSEFDIIARGAPLLNDMISSRRTPYAMPVVVGNAASLNMDAYASSAIPASLFPITGTPGPYTFSVVSGTAPAGIAFTDNSGTLSIAGTNSDVPGTYQFRLKVQSNIITDYCYLDVTIVIRTSTVSLLHFDNDLSNSIRRPVHWYSVSGAQASTTAPIFNGSSFVFDGVNSCLKSDVSDNNKLMSDFTIEGWANVSDLTESRCFFDTRLTTTSSNNIAVAIDATGKVYFYRSSTNTIYTGTISVSVNTWFHWAVVKYKNTIMLYVNGILSLTLANFTEAIESGFFMLGRSVDATGYRFKGYLSEFRVTTKALYFDTFSVPTVPFISGLMDLEYQNRLVHLRLTGDVGSTQVVNSVYGTIPAPWTASVATVSTTESVFGGSSLRLTGGAGAYSPVDDNYSMGSSDFTWECFFRYDALTGFQSIITNRASANSFTDQIVLGIDVSGNIYVYSTGMLIQTPSSLAANTWAHIALSVQSHVGRVFINGVQIGSSFTVPTLVNNKMSLGSNLDASEPLKGYIDEFRITKGVSRYNSNFTPPAAPFTY